MSDFSMIISCGGTGGHFYPGLSIARECQSQGHDVRLYVAGKHSESQKKTAGSFNLETDIGKAVRLPAQKWKLPFFFFIFFLSVIGSVFYLLKHRPKAVLVMGSFASVPLGLAAAITFTPLFLHEGNTVAGRANRLLSRWAKLLFTSFALKNLEKIECPTEETGMPLRPELENCADESMETCRERLGFDKDKPLLLVFGGSQGARKINEALYASIEKVNKSFQLLHLTGQEDNSKFEAAAATHDIKFKIMKSSDEHS